MESGSFWRGHPRSFINICLVLSKELCLSYRSRAGHFLPKSNPQSLQDLYTKEKEPVLLLTAKHNERNGEHRGLLPNVNCSYTSVNNIFLPPYDAANCSHPWGERLLQLTLKSRPKLERIPMMYFTS